MYAQHLENRVHPHRQNHREAAKETCSKSKGAEGMSVVASTLLKEAEL